MSHRNLLLMLTLYFAGVITYWKVAQRIYFFNDIGYHAHMAQMLISRFPWYPPYDPRWRLGILVNYPKLFPIILAAASVFQGTTPWQIYPYVLVAIRSLIPCSVYYLVSKISSWRGGVIAGALSLLATMNPDLSPQILAMVFIPIVILYFLRHLERRTWKSGALFGLLVSLIFWTHFLVFTFFTSTFIVFGLTFFGVKVYLCLKEHVNEGKDFKDCNNFRDIKSLVTSTLIAATVFFVITGIWWVTTLNFYGVNSFDSPFTRLSREEVAISSYPLWLGFQAYPILGVTIVIGLFAFGVFVWRHPQVFLKKKFMFYLLVVGIMSFILSFPLETLGIWYGPPWRYFSFLIFVCQLLAGIWGENLLKFFSNRWIVKKTRKASLNLHKIEMLILISFLLFMIPITVHINPKLNPTVRSPPIKESEANVKAMKWLNNITVPSDVIASDTAHSTWILYWTDARVLAGHYGTTNPDTEKDRVAATILYSDNYSETVKALEEYSVDYVYVDNTTTHGGAFEISIHWYDVCGGEKPQENIEKLLLLCGDPVYDENGIMIFKVPEMSHLP